MENTKHALKLVQTESDGWLIYRGWQQQLLPFSPATKNELEELIDFLQGVLKADSQLKKEGYRPTSLVNSSDNV